MNEWYHQAKGKCFPFLISSESYGAKTFWRERRSLVFVCICCFYSGEVGHAWLQKKRTIFEALPTFLQLDLVIANGDPNFTFLKRPEYTIYTCMYIHIHMYTYTFVYVICLYCLVHLFVWGILHKTSFNFARSLIEIFKKVHLFHESFSSMVRYLLIFLYRPTLRDQRIWQHLKICFLKIRGFFQRSSHLSWSPEGYSPRPANLAVHPRIRGGANLGAGDDEMQNTTPKEWEVLVRFYGYLKWHPYLKGDTFLQTIILGIHSLNIQGVTKGSFSKADWHYKGYEMCFKSFNLHTFHRTHSAFFEFPSYTSQIFKELFSNMINIISRDFCEYFFRSWCSFCSSHVIEWFSPVGL